MPSFGKKKAALQIPDDWIEKIVREVEDKSGSGGAVNPKNLDVQAVCKNFPEEFPVFIEISKGSNNKYEWDVDHNIMMLDRVLSSAVFYPYDYGFMPQTLCEDGKYEYPFDVLSYPFTCLTMHKQETHWMC